MSTITNINSKHTKKASKFLKKMDKNLIRKCLFKFFSVASISISLIYSTSSYAGIEKLIKNITPKGTLSNVSRLGVIKDQLAGHLIGGSVIVKSPANPDLQLLNVTPPSCKIGGLPCAAQFDLRAGALSYINAKEMMEFLKQLPANAGVYAGIMAIKTICPQCEDLMTWMESIARDINGKANLNCNDMMKQIGGFAANLGLVGEANRQSDLVTTGGGRDMTDIANKAKKDNGNTPEAIVCCRRDGSSDSPRSAAAVG